MDQWGHAHVASTSPTPLPSGAQNVTVFVEPDDQKGPIIDAIHGANSSILLEMYELTDIHEMPTVLNALVAAAQRGINVQILLTPNAYPPVSRSTFPAYSDVTDLLKAAQPHLQFQANLAHVNGIRHQKFMVIDNSVAYIMTANLSVQAFGGGAFGGFQGQVNREYIIRDTDPQDILTLQTLFQADWQGNPFSQSLVTAAPNLVVSPINSFNMLKALIDSAQSSLYVASEEFNDLTTIGQALISAVNRPTVKEVQLMLPPPQQQASPSSQDQASASAIAAIQQGGVAVKTDAFYYMHAKIIIVDKKLAFVGSQNLSTGSLGHNREVGIIVSKPDVVDKLCKTFQADWLSNPQTKPVVPA